MKRLSVLSGAGVSKESGINTFRDSGGLWEQYPVEEVASIEGWYRNPGLVLDFYNARRRDVQHREPNEAHRIIAELEKDFKVTVITQNIDNYQGPRRALPSARIRYRLQRHTPRRQGQPGRAAASAHRLVRRAGAHDRESRRSGLAV